MAVGVLSDSNGDFEAFNAAYELLRARGARRFLFAGNCYSDLDEWVVWKKARLIAPNRYSDSDFLIDVANHLSDQPQLDRPPAFFSGSVEGDQEAEELKTVKDRFLRTPERNSLHYLNINIPRKTLDMLGDALCCLVHDRNDLTRDDLLNSVVFVHGKEPEPKVVQIGPRYFVCPGRLSGGPERTVGYLEILPDRQLSFSAFTLEGKAVIDGQVLAIDRKTRLSVK